MDWRYLLRAPEIALDGDRLVERSMRGTFELPLANVVDARLEVSSHSAARLCLTSSVGNRLSIAIDETTESLRRSLGPALAASGAPLPNSVRDALGLAPGG